MVFESFYSIKSKHFNRYSAYNANFEPKIFYSCLLTAINFFQPVWLFLAVKESKPLWLWHKWEKNWRISVDLVTPSWRNFDTLRKMRNQSNQAKKVVISNANFSKPTRFQKPVLQVTDTLSKSLISFKSILL